MYIAGGEAIAIAQLIGIVIVFIIPFLVSFFISYYIFYRIFSRKSKKNRFYIKFKPNRHFWTIVISIILGTIGMYLIAGIIITSKVDINPYVDNHPTRFMVKIILDILQIR